VNIRVSYLWLCKIPVFRPHSSITYADAACWDCCYRPSSVVCLSVRHSTEFCKNGWSDRDAVCVEDSGRPKEPCIRWGPDRPWDEAVSKGKEAACCKVIATLPWAVQKRLNWTDREAVRDLDSRGPNELALLHTGAIWRIPLNRPRSAAMRPVLSNCFEHVF